MRARSDAKITLGITGLRLHEILGRDYGFKKPYRRPFFTFLLVMLSESPVHSLAVLCQILPQLTTHDLCMPGHFSPVKLTHR